MKFIFVLFTIFIAPAQAFIGMPEIKIKIGEGLKTLAVKGMDLKKVSDSGIQLYSGKRILKLLCQNRGVKDPLVASVTSHAGIINWNKKKFTGSLEFIDSLENKNCDVIHKLPLETYISSVLAKEMRADWPLEALKAQAVAARSYAYFMMKSERIKKSLGQEVYHLENSEKHQVTGSFSDQSEKTSSASKQTHGLVLMTKNKKLIPIFYHSKCGGKTVTPDKVWGKKVEGYESVSCPFCYFHGKKEWRVVVPKAEMRQVLSKYYKGNPTLSKAVLTGPLSLVPDKTQKDTLNFFSGSKLLKMNKTYLRRKLGRGRLPSNNIRVHSSGKKLYVYGNGHGHGVGMCQFGAYELAKRGWDYKQILSYYYPNHDLKKLY